MKILIITYFFPPQNSIASLRPYSWAKYWTKRGHEVSVLTIEKQLEEGTKLNYDLSPYNILEVGLHPMIKKLRNKGDNNTGQTSSNKKGIKDFAIVPLKKLNKFLGSRGINHSCRYPDIDDLWINSAIEKAIQQETTWDIAVSTVGPYSTLIIGNRLKQKELIKKLVVDYRDLWVDNQYFKGLFPFTLYEKYLEKKLLKTADGVVTVSKGFSTLFNKRYNLPKLATIENGFDLEDISSISEKKYFDDDKIRIALTGSVYYPRQSPEVLFKLISELDEQDKNQLEVLFVGGNVHVLENLVIKYRLQDIVKLQGLIPRTDVLRVQRDADVLLLIEVEKDYEDGVLPGKLFEYLFSGTPIWAWGITEKKASGNIIKQSSSGILFGQDSKQLKTELTSLIKNKKPTTLKQNKNYILKYSREHLAYKYLQIIEEL